jgi:hypothetical protein
LARLSKTIPYIVRKTAKYINKKRTKRLALKEKEIVYLFRKNIKTKRLSNKLNYTKIGPYRIKEKLEPVTFKLELLKRIRIYLVFYISLLEPALSNIRLGLVHIDKEIKEPLYKIKEIIRFKAISDKLYYLVY